jgi:hypothetical protein
MMKRRLLNLLTMLSLLLCVAVAVLWVRSYWRNDALEFSHRGSKLQLVSVAGRLRLDNAPQLDTEWARHVATLEKTLLPRHHTMVRERNEASRPANVRRSLTSTSYFEYSVPTAVPALAAGLLSSVFLGRVLLARRRNHVGTCRACGYDLRATPGRCPECGTASSAGTPA